MAGRRGAPRSRGGFILMEAVVALAILSVAAVAAMGAVDRDLDAARRTRRALETAALLEDRLQAVRLLDAAGLASPPDSAMRGRFPPPFGGYAWHSEARPVYGFPGLWNVRIDVTWTGGERLLETLFYRPGAGRGS